MGIIPLCEFVDDRSSCKNLRLVAMRLQNADYVLHGGGGDVVSGTENSQVECPLEIGKKGLIFNVLGVCPYVFCSGE